MHAKAAIDGSSLLGRNIIVRYAVYKVRANFVRIIQGFRLATAPNHLANPNKQLTLQKVSFHSKQRISVVV